MKASSFAFVAATALCSLMSGWPGGGGEGGAWARSEPRPPAPPGDDPYAWLEDIDGSRALDWVSTRNAATVKELAANPEFERLQGEILEVLDSDARIPTVRRMGNYLYNFWRDKEHPRGLWRRTTLEEYRKPHPRWTVLVDVGALGKAEHENWVWQGEVCLKPDYRHCMIGLSRGGADASVRREYDLTTRAFVANGFVLPEAKTNLSWQSADTLFVGTDFGPGSLTKSGYARVAKLWKRGTPIGAASTVFEGEPDDVSVTAVHDATPGFERDLVRRNIDRFHVRHFVRAKDGKLTAIEVPEDAVIDLEREWLLVRTRSPWTVGSASFPAGALVAARFADYMAGRRELTLLYQPSATSALSGHSWTRHHLLITSLDNVSAHIEVLTPPAGKGAGAWKREPLVGLPELSSADVFGGDPDRSDEYFLTVNGYLTPSTLARGLIGAGKPEPLKHAPVFFDAARLEVHQAFATSKDGTRVPYFMIAPAGLSLDGKNRTLLYGYGGFEISMLPNYNGAVGRAWLSRGGVYVVANIRGGGEFGPRWHQAARRENRLRAYEDFAAVAEDLIARKVTSPAHLGAQGGSNGGLLAGNMLTRYPRLFGAVVSEVPLLDMKRYTHLSAGASWIDEYGDPDRPADWAFLQTFSPYHNVKKGEKYPPVLFTTSTRDDRVGPVHARKMVAKLLDLGIDARFYENVEGGHGAAADNKQLAFMRALGYSFLWNRLQ